MKLLYLDELKALMGMPTKREHRIFYKLGDYTVVMKHWSLSRGITKGENEPECLNRSWRLFYKGFAVMDCIKVSCADSVLTRPHNVDLFSKNQYKKIIDTIILSGQATEQDFF